MNTILIGIDEAGRGPIFGPMTVGATANPTRWFFPGIKDSKEIKKESLRQALAVEIKQNTIWATAVVSAECINRFGTIRSLREAGRKVAAEMVARVRGYFPEFNIRVVFDGRDHQSETDGLCTYESIEKADATIFEVSCASIIAKVLHDDLIHEIVKSDRKYERYDLNHCRGYGTPKHKAALQEFGRTDQHRTAACNTILGITNGKACKTPQ
jgi:ribonuclease HII